KDFCERQNPVCITSAQTERSDHYQKFLDGEEDILYIKKEDDPFWEPVEDLLLGTANVFLQSLAYSLDFDDEICIVDYKGLEQGRLGITLSPCAANGKPIIEEQFVDQPEELLNKPYSFKLVMRHIEINDEKYSKGVRIRYRLFNEQEFTNTDVIGKQTMFANIKQTRIITVPSVDHNWLNFFENGCIIFQIYAVQEESKPDHRLFKMTTKELKIMEQKQEESNVLVQTNTMLPGDSKLKSELTLLQRKLNRLEQKEKCMQGKNDDDIEIYLFGSDEQDYLHDIEHQNTDKLKYWEEYHRKTSLKQRRSSVAFRNTSRLPLLPTVSPKPDILPSQQNGNLLSIVNDKNLLNSSASVKDIKSTQQQQDQNDIEMSMNDSNANLKTNSLLFNTKNSVSCSIQ
ncbi:unnamed protein product, partial [Didymodactylos carnosus]